MAPCIHEPRTLKVMAPPTLVAASFDKRKPDTAQELAPTATVIFLLK